MVLSPDIWLPISNHVEVTMCAWLHICAYCYDLMDAAYDAAQIWEQSRELDHVPIIDRNPCGEEVISLAPHEAEAMQLVLQTGSMVGE